MAPQAIEMAQNGIGDPPVRGCWESIRRIPYQMKALIPPSPRAAAGRQDNSA